MKLVNKMIFPMLAAFLFSAPLSAFAQDADIPDGADNFYQSSVLKSEKVEFKNMYDMTVAGLLYAPKNQTAKLPALIVGHPMGAVKEQSARLYAQKMAEKGFVALAIDLPFWGESGGSPRNNVSPEIYADAFSAAADYLSTRSDVDADKIGVIGICGSGSFAVSEAKIDPRLKAIATVSMYDMGAASRNGLRKSISLKQRKEIISASIKRREAEFKGAKTAYTGGTVHELTGKSSPVEREFYGFYRTKRGKFTPKGATDMTTTHPTLASNTKFMNFYPFNDIETISPRPMMFIAGEKAHSIEFSRDAYAKAAEPKELVVVPDAGHVDLYDRVDLIPFDRLEKFFKNALK